MHEGEGLIFLEFALQILLKGVDGLFERTCKIFGLQNPEVEDTGD